METLTKQDAPVKKKKRTNMFEAVRNALIFVAIWGVIATYFSFGLSVAAQSAFRIVLAVVVAYLTHIIYYLVEDKICKREIPPFKAWLANNWKKIQKGAPDITALLIGLRLQMAAPLYVLVIAAVIAEVIGKLMWGGFGKNKLNPVGVSIILTRVIFDYYLRMPEIDGITAATPVSLVAQQGWYFTEASRNLFINQFGNLWDLLIGNFTGIMAETTRLASILAMFYMVNKKAVKWHIPLYYVGFVFVTTAFVGLFHGFHWDYSLFHVLNGGLIFGAIFMATDPVTIPKNKSGQIIFAILLGMLTLVIRFRAQIFAEGVVVSILIMNMFSGYINEKAAGLMKAPVKTQNKVYGLIFAISAVAVFILALGLPY